MVIIHRVYVMLPGARPILLVPPPSSQLVLGLEPSSPALLPDKLQLHLPLGAAPALGLRDFPLMQPTPLISFLFLAILILILLHVGAPPSSVVIEIKVSFISHH